MNLKKLKSKNKVELKMSAVLNVLAIIGLVAILVVVIYYIWNYISKMNKDASIAKERPTPTYMEQTGLKCPDYWMLSGLDGNGNYICEDKKELMKQYGKNSASAKCYSDVSGKKMVFSKFDNKTHWVDMSDEDKIKFAATKVNTNYSRSEWIKNCGPNVGNGVSTRAVWSGLDKYA